MSTVFRLLRYLLGIVVLVCVIAAGITNSYVYISPGTSHEWQTWRRDLKDFAPRLF